MKTDGTNPPGQGIFGLIDINCHILPGTEDGPDNFREAAEMLRIAKASLNRAPSRGG